MSYVSVPAISIKKKFPPPHFCLSKHEELASLPRSGRDQAAAQRLSAVQPAFGHENHPLGPYIEIVEQDIHASRGIPNFGIGKAHGVNMIVSEGSRGVGQPQANSIIPG